MKVLMALVLRLDCVRGALAAWSVAVGACAEAYYVDMDGDEISHIYNKADRAEAYVTQNIAAAATRKIMRANEQFGPEDAEWLEEKVRNVITIEVEKIRNLQTELARRKHDEGYQVERAIEESNHRFAFDQTEQDAYHGV